MSAISPDGSTLVTTTDESMMIWDVATGKLRANVDKAVPYYFHGLCFSADSKYIVGLGHYKPAIVFRAVDGSIVKRWDSGGAEKGIAISPDGKTIATPNHRQIRLWDWQSDDEPLSPRQHGLSVRAVAVNSNGDRFAFGSSDGRVHVQGVDGKQPSHPIGRMDGPVNQLAFSSDDHFLVDKAAASQIIMQSAIAGTALRLFAAYTSSQIAARYGESALSAQGLAMTESLRIAEISTCGQCVRTIPVVPIIPPPVRLRSNASTHRVNRRTMATTKSGWTIEVETKCVNRQKLFGLCCFRLLLR